MLNTLSYRNAKRSAKDYLIYLVTMSIISALMFAFHGMIFSDDMKTVYNDMMLFVALVLVASFFVMFIVIWLVHYMVQFMLERCSREFGTYLLLGMQKKQIVKVFLKENILLGAASLLIGILPGFLFQKLFINVFYSVLDVEYDISAEFSLLGLLITAGVLMLAYLFAFIRVKRRFKKLKIRDLIYMEKKNEEIINEKSTRKALFVFAAIAYIVLFHVLAFGGMMGSLSVWLYVIGLIVSIYMLYVGLSSFFVSFIKKKNKSVYKKANLFIMRQLSSKIKTMRFTMGTLSILFTAALLGWTVVMMFGDYQNKRVATQIPFDVLVFSDQKEDDFKGHLQVLWDNVEVHDSHLYQIHENGTNAVNDFLYKHRSGTYRTEAFHDGKMGDNTYFGYDTYIGLSDYNRIREMINLDPLKIEPGSYILHGKESIEKELIKITEQVEVKVGQEVLKCQEIRMEHFSQEGMNGADYIIVVPDQSLLHLEPYYSLLAAEVADAVPADLKAQLKEVKPYFNEELNEDLFEIEVGRGSSQVLSWADTVIVAENAKKEADFTITTVCFILGYLGIVFLCTALTILAVQQLSDASKYQFRYLILKQLGLSNKNIRKVVFKQLAVYYMCPLTVSILLSMFIGLFISDRFVYFTGIAARNFQYYILSVLVFGMIYAAYFIISYVGVIRNLKMEK